MQLLFLQCAESLEFTPWVTHTASKLGLPLKAAAFELDLHLAYWSCHICFSAAQQTAIC